MYIPTFHVGEGAEHESRAGEKLKKMVFIWFFLQN